MSATESSRRHPPNLLLLIWISARTFFWPAKVNVLLLFLYDSIMRNNDAFIIHVISGGSPYRKISIRLFFHCRTEHKTERAGERESGFYCHTVWLIHRFRFYYQKQSKNENLEQSIKWLQCILLFPFYACLFSNFTIHNSLKFISFY